MSLTITEKAVERVKEIRTKRKLPDTAVLRVGVKGGGCSGLSYVIDVDNEPIREGIDRVFEQDGVKLVCDKKSLLYLVNTQIDFSDALTGGGFTFSNPNATKTCGCGTSFTA